MDEFELIRRYFADAESDSVKLGIGDDAAVMEPSPGRQLVAAMDTLVEGVHYPKRLHPTDIGYRLGAVNLSDFAAMGATPRWMLLSLTIPSVDADWLESFAAGLKEVALRHGVALVGGDTTKGPVTTLALQVIGEVDPDSAIRRSGAKAGDRIYVTGHPGNAAGGLELIQEGEHDDDLVAAFARPEPRVSTGQQLAGIATAAIDVSDGLFADLGKLLNASDRGAELYLDELPLSDALVRVFGPAKARRMALGGGDDYEILFTATEDLPSHLAGLATCIGRVGNHEGIRCYEGGQLVDYDDSGYLHFA